MKFAALGLSLRKRLLNIASKTTYLFSVSARPSQSGNVILKLVAQLSKCTPYACHNQLPRLGQF